MHLLVLHIVFACNVYIFSVKLQHTKKVHKGTVMVQSPKKKVLSPLNAPRVQGLMEARHFMVYLCPLLRDRQSHPSTLTLITLSSRFLMGTGVNMIHLAKTRQTPFFGSAAKARSTQIIGGASLKETRNGRERTQP